MQDNRAPVITIDGPSGSGKGSLARILANKLQWHLLDSGKLYRVLAYQLNKNNLLNASSHELYQMAKTLPVAFNAEKCLLDGVVITELIADEAIGNIASKISTIPEVRAGLLAFQLNMQRMPGLIADGRDMGTVVFPHAPLKIYLDAAVEVRAKRRVLQLNELGLAADYQVILTTLIERDLRDKNRVIAPLKPAADAVYIDASDKTLATVVDFCLELIAKTNI